MKNVNNFKRPFSQVSTGQWHLVRQIISTGIGYDVNSLLWNSVVIICLSLQATSFLIFNFFQIYFMDTQIWYTIWSALVGALVGLLDHLGEVFFFHLIDDGRTWVEFLFFLLSLRVLVFWILPSLISTGFVQMIYLLAEIDLVMLSWFFIGFFIMVERLCLRMTDWWGTSLCSGVPKLIFLHNVNYSDSKCPSTEDAVSDVS